MTKELRATSSGSAATTRKQVRGDSRCTIRPTMAALTALPAACKTCCFVKAVLQQGLEDRQSFLCFIQCALCAVGKSLCRVASIGSRP